MRKRIGGFLHTLAMLAAILGLFLVGFFNFTRTPVELAQLQFQGEYSINHEPFAPLTRETQLNATHGPLILRGNFVWEDGQIGLPAGQSLNFYLDHIAAAVWVNGELYYHVDMKQFGEATQASGEDFCSAAWHAMPIDRAIDAEDQVEICLTNAHSFGNPKAYIKWQEGLYYADETEFEDYLLREAVPTWIGIGAIIIFSVCLFGTALGYVAIGNPLSRKIGYFGFFCIFMADFLLFESGALAQTNNHLLLNHLGRYACLILGSYELCRIVQEFLTGKRQRAAGYVTAALVILDALMLLLSLFGWLNFYDTAAIWLPLQCVVLLLSAVCGVLELPRMDWRNRAMLSAFLVLQLVLLWEVVNSAIGWFAIGTVIKPVFFVFFLISVVVITRLVVVNQARAVKAEELEQQLTESRISTMISQIQPHFIYNTLGTIGHLCQTQPEKASELVQNFSMYLRGNFSELDNPSTIELASEIEHVRYYTEIEKVRFPDMTILYDIQTQDVYLPALTIQPLVENAIKHGLMGLESGGTVKISAFETGGAYLVRIEDDGVGFDTSVLQDERKHIGIRNIRERLEAMCNGTLKVESKPGKGTCATISIPKERRGER